MAGLLGMFGIVEMTPGVTVRAEGDHHGVAVQNNRRLAQIGVPVARLAGFAGAVGTNKNRLLTGLGKDFVVSTELEAGVLRVAVKFDRSGARAQPGGELDELTARHVV